MKKIFALVDCNSFYASCEKIFRPDLKDKPVIVLSNNDGCVVALSKEAKKIGIKRAVPLFEIQHLVSKYDVQVFSSNYELYGDISRRIMNILRKYSPAVEVYSIDEAFLDITGIDNISAYVAQIQKEIKDGIKIPVSIGIGPSKTLAKLANKIGKDNKTNIFDITNFPDKNSIFKKYGIHDVWGIGFQLTKMLHKYNIFSIYDFINLDDAWVKKKMTSKGLLTLWELRGIHCIDLAEKIPDKKQIISSRSFGTPVTTLKELKESVAYHTNLASRKLREQNSLCKTIIVHISTNEFKKDLPQYKNSAAFCFLTPTDYTADMINQAHRILEKIYKPGFIYKRAGVILTEITYNKNKQIGLFEEKRIYDKKNRLIKVIDTINKHGNYDIIRPASYKTHNIWQMKRNMKSPNYTTSWADIPLVKA